MVLGHRPRELGPGHREQIRPFLRVELLRLEPRDEILVPKVRLIAEGLLVVLEDPLLVLYISFPYHCPPTVQSSLPTVTGPQCV